MTRPAPHRPAPAARRDRTDDVRRLRDVIRAAVLRGDGGGDRALPGENELMAAYGMSRATVREALALLRAEGLIERVQGVGTYGVATTQLAFLADAHGMAARREDTGLHRRMRPRVLDRSVIPAPGAVAERLGVPADTPCLRLEYIGLLEEEPVILATNYALFPEAERLRDTRFSSDWPALLARAGIEPGLSEFTIGTETADPLIASALAVRPGTPLVSMEQIIGDRHGRLFDLAFIHARADRVRFVSRMVRGGPERT